jgi:CheY-specific phosphatase CheX
MGDPFMADSAKTIDRISLILCQAVKEVMGSCTGQEVTYASTIQDIPNVSLRPELGSFVTLGGDYRGLIVWNFPGKTAVNAYRSYMIAMGMPADGLPTDWTSPEVADGIGEMSNQMVGTFMRMVQETFELGASCSQPKALALNSQIALIIDADFMDNRRLAFSVGGDRFTVELAMEQTEFSSLPE